LESAAENDLTTEPKIEQNQDYETKVAREEPRPERIGFKKYKN